ncbi:Ribonucleases P/MRP protein subunit POP1, partial [Geodia barretti]
MMATYFELTWLATLQDVSYQCCIEVAGSRCDVLSCLTPFFSGDTGLTPAAVSYENGSRAGHCVMYRSGTYPSGAIGPVEFLWQPVNNDVDTARLWLTVPPAIHDEVMDELTAAVEKGFRTGCHGDYQLETDNSGVSGDERRRSKVTVTSLRDEFVRFRLVGPRSHAVLMETLKPITEGNDTTTFVRSDAQTITNETVETSETSDAGTLSFSKPDLSRIPSPVPWWRDEDEALATHNKRLQRTLEDLRSATEPGEFPKGTVVGMVVQDPRLFTPSKKTDMVSEFYPRRKVDW